MKNRIAVIALAVIILPFSAYFTGWFLVDFYISNGAAKLVKMEKRGQLSRHYGYVWQEININKDMNQLSGKISGDSIINSDENSIKENEKRPIPSLSAIGELNSLKNLYRTIRITDRFCVPLAQLQTSHTCINVNDVNHILLGSLLETEDKNFYKRNKAWDYNALVRSLSIAIWRSLTTFRLHKPRGSSTIHMQVARFLLMKYDNRGYAFTERSISRKILELKLAQALKLTYSDQQILTTYINHCITAGKGMRGYYDISKKLFGVAPNSLNIAQSLYLARLVKWNRHVPSKIIRQIKTSMPIIARRFQWSYNQQDSIFAALDSLRFKPAVNVIPSNSHLIDLANEYWKNVCKLNGMGDSELAEVDIANPESMIRRYGNLTIKLTIDARLQSVLEKIVNSRGFGPDTLIRSDIRIASEGINLPVIKFIPQDTLRKIIVLSADSTINDASTGNVIRLCKNDTLVLNVRYKKNKDHIRRSVFIYKRDTVSVSGQYFAYAIMDSKSRELLAYYSRDKLGSRLQSLHVNRNPNGSSTSKPLIYALAYDWGIYNSTDMISDDCEIADTCDWARISYGIATNPSGMTYLHSGKKGYTVHNHHRRFDGYDYLYNHLYKSNNIIAVETMYRLNTDLTIDNEQSQRVGFFLERTGLWGQLGKNQISGPSLYTAVAGLCADSAISESTILKFKDRYSSALGTLELSLYEQMHIFGILYDGNLAVNPAKHPGLFIKKIELAGNEVSFKDSISQSVIFENLDNISPVQLALHKRLVSDKSEHLKIYDICSLDNEQVRSNFAKSGTTDDIIRHYYSEKFDTLRTCYGLWNAVLRLSLTRNDMYKILTDDPKLKIRKDLNKLCFGVPEKELVDVTLACIGECDIRHTGFPDGKTLHSYVSRSLLQEFGVPCTSGFYKDYEKQIIDQTSNRVKFANPDSETDLSTWSKLVLKFKTGFGSDISRSDMCFEKSRNATIRLKGKNYRTMLKFGTYMGNNSKRYISLVERLRVSDDLNEVNEILDEMGKMEIKNQFLMSELQNACESLGKSAKELLAVDKFTK